MRNKIKYLKMWLFSFVILFASSILFMLCFYHERNLKLYIICAVVFTAFCIWFYYSNKKIMCEDGYNLMQAYLFYNKCKKNGITPSPQKLTKKEIEHIVELASSYDFSKDFDSVQAKNLYKNGYNVDREIKRKKKERSKNI